MIISQSAFHFEDIKINDIFKSIKTKISCSTRATVNAQMILIKPCTNQFQISQNLKFKHFHCGSLILSCQMLMFLPDACVFSVFLKNIYYQVFMLNDLEKIVHNVGFGTNLTQCSIIV